MPHRFFIGQRVRPTGRFADGTGDRVFEIIRLLPEERGECGYRIKAGEHRPVERAVRESEITPATP